MLRDHTVRSAALRLRIKGKSYNEISKELNIAKSTARSWLGDIVLSDDAQRRLAGRVREGSWRGLLKRSKMQTHLARMRAQKTRTDASGRISRLDQNALLLIGAVLYWAEGYKRVKMRNGKQITSHLISFVNSDPAMVRFFVSFLTDCLHVARDDIRLTMRLYPHINEKAAAKHWLDATGLTESNLRKTTMLVSGASKGKRPFNRLEHGTIQLAVYSTNKFYELMGLIDGVKREIARDILPTLPG